MHRNITQKYKMPIGARGIILIDILLAMSLAVLFIAIISESTLGARKVYERAKERNRLLDIYEEAIVEFQELEHLSPYQTVSLNELRAQGTWYGNDRIETIIDISSAESRSIFPYAQKVSFQKVRSAYVDGDAGSDGGGEDDVRGTPLCTVEFSGASDVAHNDVPVSPTISKIDLPISASLPLTDLVVRNGIAYISADSSTSADPDILIVDMSSVDDASGEVQPRVLSSLNTGPGVTAIALRGRNIYAAAASTAAQVHIIRMNDLSDIFLERKYQLSLPYATATPPFASSIFYNHGYLYVGTEKWISDEFNILSLADPSGPTKVGGFEIGSKVGDIFVRTDPFVNQDRAYLATAGEGQLQAFDVHDNASPISIYSFNPSGWQRQEGRLISLFEDTFLFGRTSGGFNITQDAELFRFATSSILVTPPFTEQVNRDILGGVYGIVADRDHVYVATHSLGAELQIFDHSLATSTVRTFSLPGTPRTMICDAHSLYVLSQNEPAIYQITL